MTAHRQLAPTARTLASLFDLQHDISSDWGTIVLLYGPRSQVLSSRLFDWWQGGFVEEGVVLGLVQAAIVLGAFGLAHFLGQRRLVGTS